MKETIGGFDGVPHINTFPIAKGDSFTFYEAPGFSAERFIPCSQDAWYLPNGGTHGFRPFMTNNPELAQYYKAQGCLVIAYKVKK